MKTDRTDLPTSGNANAADELELVDVLTIEETLARAQALRGTTPDLSELAELKQLLRGHIALLLPYAQSATDNLWRGSVEWSARMGRLSGIRFQFKQAPGQGRHSTHVQINQLTRDCQWLLDDHKEREQTR